MQPVKRDNGFRMITQREETVGTKPNCNADVLHGCRIESFADHPGRTCAQLRRTGSATYSRTKQHHSSSDGSTTTQCFSKMCPLAAVSASSNAALREIDGRKFEVCDWDTQIADPTTKLGSCVPSSDRCFVGNCQPGLYTPQKGSQQDGLRPANWAKSSLVGKSESWRAPTSRSFNGENAALERALGSMRKLSGEPEAVRRKLIQFGDRSITGPDARTMSLREPGRWGSKVGGGTYYLAPRSVVETTPIQRIQCLHCGSFSTTPVFGGARSKSRSQSFRRVRDYSWQQELHDQVVHKQLSGRLRQLKMSDQNGEEACMQNWQGADGFHDSDSDSWLPVGPESATLRQQGWALEGGNVSWKNHMFLSAMLAQSKDEMGSSSCRWRGGCDCASCRESSESMMTFSGPIGYASESKAKVEEMYTGGRKVGRQQRYWGLRWGKSKLKGVHGQAQECVACGQRAAMEAGRLCGQCHGRREQRRSPIPPPPPPLPHQHFSGKASASASASRKWRLVKLCRYLLGFPIKTG